MFEAPKQKISYGDEVEDELLSRKWPGNVRELKHVAQATLALSKRTTISRGDIYASRLVAATEAGSSDQNDRLDKGFRIIQRLGGISRRAYAEELGIVCR